MRHTASMRESARQTLLSAGEGFVKKPPSLWSSAFRAGWMMFLFSLIVVIILTAPNLHARRRRTPENPSAILYLGGSAVVAWRYIKARWIH